VELEFADIAIASAPASCEPVAVSGVRASAYQSPNVAANTIDDNLSTRWSNDGKGSWIRLDLGKRQPICEVQIAWQAGHLRSSNFVVSVSNSTSGSTFKTVFSGKSSGTTTALETYDVKDSNARYVRITVNGNTMNNWASITEIEILRLYSNVERLYYVGGVGDSEGTTVNVKVYGPSVITEGQDAQFRATIHLDAENRPIDPHESISSWIHSGSLMLAYDDAVVSKGGYQIFGSMVQQQTAAERVVEVIPARDWDKGTGEFFKRIAMSIIMANLLEVGSPVLEAIAGETIDFGLGSLDFEPSPPPAGSAFADENKNDVLMIYYQGIDEGSSPKYIHDEKAKSFELRFSLRFDETGEHALSVFSSTGTQLSDGILRYPVTFNTAPGTFTVSVLG
jgi:hypothetical protein